MPLSRRMQQVRSSWDGLPHLGDPNGSRGKKPKIEKDPVAPAPENITVSMKDYELEEEDSSEEEHQLWRMRRQN